MPHVRKPPPQLPFSFTVAEARHLGLSREWLNHKSIAAPFYGVRASSESIQNPAHLHERVLQQARLFKPRLRTHEAVSHQSALLLYGCPIHTPEELHVTAMPPHSRNRSRGVVGHQSSTSIPTRSLHELPVVAPLQALMQCAAALALRELTVASNHLTRAFRHQNNAPLVAHDDLVRAATEFRGRGASRLRRAASITTGMQESRMETLTWLLLVAYGLAEHFDPQVEIYDDSGFIGRFDFVARALRLIVEYDGEQHRTDRHQYTKDLARLDRARAAGYTVVRLLREHVLVHPRETSAHLARLLKVELNPHKFAREMLGRGLPRAGR